LSRDPAEARRLLEIAAAAGDTTAQRDLGYTLVNPGDSGLQADPRRGVQLLTQAAEKGDGRAMELLGRVYLEGGKGVSPQPETAEVWLTRAAEKGFGHVPTTPQAAALPTDPEPETDSAQDIASLQAATDQGDQAARVRLATLYLFGDERVQAQPQKGEDLLRPAVRDGDASAKLVLGLAYLHGSFGERRIDEGSLLLFEAARAGNPSARNVLTRTVLHAQGLEETERTEAEAWLDARLAGDFDAGLAELTAMLRKGLSDAPLSTSQAAEDEAAER
jgi:TPR repeat protein